VNNTELDAGTKNAGSKANAPLAPMVAPAPRLYNGHLLSRFSNMPINNLNICLHLNVLVFSR